MHNIKSNKHFPEYIWKKFERVTWKHNYNNIHFYKGKRQLCITENSNGKGEKSIVYWGLKIWQEIPTDMKSKPLVLFKKKFANYLISNYCMWTDDACNLLTWSDAI